MQVLSFEIAHKVFDTDDDTEGNNDVVELAPDDNAEIDDEFDVDDVAADVNAGNVADDVTFNDVDVSGERGVTTIGEYVGSDVCELEVVRESERVG